jgi:Tfp pilus assembly protein PilX
MTRQDGIAMPVVMGILLVLMLSAASIATTSIRSSDNANKDRNSKRALSAAEAGIQTAVNRLGQIKPANTMCLTTVPVAPVSGECPSSTPEPAGAGATFRYYVTQKGATCGALPGYTPSVNDRCVTAIGTVNGVTRRLQVRVNQDPAYVWAQTGMVGLESVNLSNNVKVEDTDVASNGVITLTGSPGDIDIESGAVRRGPSGSVVQSGAVNIDDGIIQSTYDYRLPQPNFASTLPSQGGTNNNNLLNATYYNSTTRALTIPANVTYTMPAGTYNLCRFQMGVKSELNMSSSSAVGTIYVDSPRRAGSGCPSDATLPNSGKVRLIGSSADQAKINTGQADKNVFVYVYGTTDNASAEDIYLTWGHYDALFYAPDSIFRATTNVTMHGGVAARKVVMDFNVDQKLDMTVAMVPTPPGLPVRKAWLECKPIAPTPSNPESGC